jgi:protein SCO1/2
MVRAGSFLRRGAPRGALLGLASMLVIGACGVDEYVPAGIVRTPPPDVGGVALPDAATGGELTLEAKPDSVLVVYFGYTACPDICPTTMADVRTALRDLDELADRVDVAMVTVDPDRDTAEVLTSYVQAFVEDGHALRTDDPEALAAAAAPFGAQYEVTVQDDGWVDVVHSAFLYAVDDRGRLRLTWPFGIEPELIEADLRALLEGELDDA